MTLAQQFIEITYKDNYDEYDRFVTKNLLVKARISEIAGFFSVSYIFKDGSVAGFSTPVGKHYSDLATRYESEE